MNETYSMFVRRLIKPMGREMNLCHAALGATSEAGELATAVKAHVIYGREIDMINILEEAGDTLFFVEFLLQECGFTMDDAIAANRAKLSARYEKGYSDAAANNRKKEFEREAIRRAVWGDADA